MTERFLKSLLALLICLSVMITDRVLFNVSAEAESGSAYAVLTDNGDLVFARSTDTYTNGNTGTLTDVNGNTYTGIIYSNVENTETIPWARKRNSIRKVYVAPNTRIAPQTLSWWFGECVNMTSFNASGFNTVNVVSMAHLFHNCKSLSNLDLSGFATSKVQIMCSMFEGCSSLSSLNISSFNTASVYDMTEMFRGCEKLTSVNLNSITTSAVIGMKGMFDGCRSLTSLNLGGFNTAKVTDMSAMFRGCSSITTLDISAFNTAKVTEMREMFRDCSSLKTLSVNGIDTAKVTDMSSMFESCGSLTSLNLSSFNTAKVTDMSGMFYGCKKLINLNVSGFNTSSVKNMDGMFADCSEIKTLNIDHFVTDKLETMSYVFYGCSRLEELYINGFNTAKVTDMTGRFDRCNSLKEVKLGTVFTKWSDDAYLPEGYWKNGHLLKTETELYEDYGANANDWAGTWIRTNTNEYIKRAFGSNRYKTGMAVTDVFMEITAKKKLDCLIIASGTSFADALAGSYLAAVKNAPIILINDGNIDTISSYISDKMNPDGTIYILGGTAAVSQTAERELKRIATVSRIEGSNRYFTNLAILEEAGMDKDTILVGTGLNFADSLSASATGLPILLVKDELSSRQKEFLQQNRNKNIIILGGTGAVNSYVEDQLRQYGEVSRVAGSNRFETSLKIAEKFFPNAKTAVIAYSHEFPDGLCGGALGYQLNGPVILTREQNASSAKAYVREKGITGATVMGGLTRLDDSVVRDIMGVNDSYVIQYYYR